MFNFDENGNLTPYQAIETTLEEFEKTFVSDFPNSRTRRDLFEEYKSWLTELKELVGFDFFQFLNGSFVSRKLNPQDIDVVTFLDYAQKEVLDRELLLLKFKFRKRGIDSYYQEIYLPGHADFRLNNSGMIYWAFTFSRNRDKQSKGFIKLVIEQ